MATSRSFQVHRNWKMAKEASAGKDSGRMILTKISKSLAPSTRALSMISFGRPEM
ncbi:hypothetical protein D3C86_1777340 [compost metagenome]